MRWIGWVGLVATVCIAPMGAAVRAHAQDSPPSRIANEWDGKDHQPTSGAVSSAEASRGVRPSAQQQQAEDRDLNAIDRQLLPGSTPPVSRGALGRN